MFQVLSSSKNMQSISVFRCGRNGNRRIYLNTGFGPINKHLNTGFGSINKHLNTGFGPISKQCKKYICQKCMYAVFFIDCEPNLRRFLKRF